MKDESKETPLDLDNRRYRTRRLTGRSSSMGDYFLSPKGDKLYYVAGATEGGYNINVVDLKEGETKVLLKGMAGSLYPDKKVRICLCCHGMASRR